jgi:hypothetical protein
VDKRLVILRTVLLVFLLGVPTPQFAQDTSTGPTQSDQERLHVAIGLVRTINTAEVVERSTYGSFASWQTLLAHEQKKFSEWFASFYSHDPIFISAPSQKSCPGGICACLCNRMT